MSGPPQKIKEAALLIADYLHVKWANFDYINAPITDPVEHREYEMYLYTEGWLREMAFPRDETRNEE